MWIDYLQAKGVFAVGCMVGNDGIIAGILTIAPRHLAPGKTAVLYDSEGNSYPAVELPGWVGSTDFKQVLPYAPLQDPATNA